MLMYYKNILKKSAFYNAWMQKRCRAVLLNFVLNVQECDASKASYMFNCRAKKTLKLLIKTLVLNVKLLQRFYKRMVAGRYLAIRLS